MITALACQQLSRSQQAGVLARAALTIAAERMGGRPPEPFLEGEEAPASRDHRRGQAAPGAGARRSVGGGVPRDRDVLDAQMEAIAEPVDEEAALARVRHLVI